MSNTNDAGGEATNAGLNTENASSSGNQGNNINNNTSTRSNRNRNNRNNHNYVNLTNPKGWKGKTEEIGCVLGLESDTLTFKKSYKEYKKAVMDYILRDNKEFGRYLAAPFEFNVNALSRYRSTKVPVEPIPETGETTVANVKQEIYKKQLERFVANEEKIEGASIATFAIIEGNCSEGVQEQVRNKAGYMTHKLNGDIVWLLTILKAITSGLEITTNKYALFYEALREFVTMHQWESESDDDFNIRYKDSIETLMAHGGKHVLGSLQIIGNDAPTATELSKAEENFKAVAYVKKLNRSTSRYGNLSNIIKEQEILGNDVYPTTMNEAYTMMVTYKSKQSNNVTQGRGQGRNGSSAGRGFNRRVQFAQQHQNTGETVAGTDGKTFPSTKCYNCQNMGHISTFCPEAQRPRQGVNMTQIAVSLAQHSDASHGISKWWVLLDTCSSATTVCNEALLTNMRDATREESILLYSDAGTQVYNKMGDLKDFPMKAMFNSNGIANVLSLKEVSEIPGVVITMDTSVDPGITVTFEDGKSVKFNRSHDGIYYVDMSPKVVNKDKSTNDKIMKYSVSFAQTDIQSPTTHMIPIDDDFQSVDIQDDVHFVPLIDNSNLSSTDSNQGASASQITSPQGASTTTSTTSSPTTTTQTNQFNHTNHSHIDIINTVKQNQSHFTKKEIAKAIEARHIQQQIGWPSKSGFMKIISGNHMHNCNITIDDIIRSEYIFGTPLPLIKGKTTKPTPTPSYNLQKVNIPLPILQHHQNIDLFIDFMFVNGIPFLHTISSKLKYRHTIPCSSRKKQNIINELRKIIKTYNDRGFTIENIHGDNEFNVKDIIESVKPCTTIIYPPNEHVKEIERSIRTMKERSRCVCHSLPYKRYTKLMTLELISDVNKWLNMFPTDDAICKTMSPAMILEGTHKPDMSKQRVPFGTYAIVYTSTSNNMKSRSVEAIALTDAGPKGGCYFMNIETGKKIHGHKWTVVPISDRVIEMIHEIGIYEKRPLLMKDEIRYEWEPGVTIHDYYDNDEENNMINEGNGANEMEFEIEHDELLNMSDTNDENENENDDNMIQITDDSDDMNVIHNDNSENETEENDTSYEEYEETSDYENERNIINVNDNNEEAESIVVEDVNDEDDYTTDDSDYTTDISNDNTIPDANEENMCTENNDRPRRVNAGSGVDRLEMKFGGKTYDEAKSQFTQKKQSLAMKRWSNRKRLRHAVQLLRRARCKNDTTTANEWMNIAIKVMFTQMSAKRGIKLFGEEAIAAIYKEYKQLDEGAKKGNPVVSPTPSDTLTDEDKRQALDAVNLIKQKRCGKIKGRCAANGSKQKQYLKPEESVASPTVSLEGLLATLVIDAKEGRKVSTFDVPGAFLQAPMPDDKKVLLKLKGEFVDIMCRVNPEHEPNIQYENNVKVLYMRVERAIYGCIESALMWYNMFTEILEKMGFKLNPYDKCVANKMINGKQCTIVWYVDDVKVSHMEQSVLDDITDMMQEHFGKMDIVKGDEHSYLGMNITINRKKKIIEIDMKQQLLEAIEAFDGEIKGEVVSPAAKHIFDTRDGEVKKLPKEKAENFHHVTAKLLHLMKRVRPDIEIPIVFLCTRVKSPDEDDWKKLERVLIWIQNTIDERRYIGADDLKRLYTWVDAAYAVHPNMRSHTGGAMSMGTGVIHCKSSRQKLNTKSSTEAELVGASDYMPYNIWLMYFMKHQGFDLEVNILFQDNQSAMKMERNGRNSCTGNTRHVNIRYFWVKDRIQKGEIDLKYCPTKKMLADYFTKALQGSAFMKFWYVVMGHKHMDSLRYDDTILEDMSIEERDESMNHESHESETGMNKEDFIQRINIGN